MFTPQEVSEKTFPKASGFNNGYGMAAVDEFLDALTEDYTALYKDNAALKAKLKVLAEKVEEYRATEDAMRSTLLSAQRMAAQMVSDAQAQRDKMLSDAQEEANRQVAQLEQQVAQAQHKLTMAQASLSDFLRRSADLCAQQVSFLHSLPEAEVEEGQPVTLPAPEEGQQPVYDSRAKQGAGAGTEEEDHASTQKRTAQAPVHSQTAVQDQPVTMPPSLNDGQNAAGDTGDGSGSTESVVGDQAIFMAPQPSGLTLPQLPQGAEEVLDDQTQWTDNGDGTRSCTVTADQARQLLALARDQGMDCPEVGTEEETLVLTVPGEEG